MVPTLRAGKGLSSVSSLSGTGKESEVRAKGSKVLPEGDNRTRSRMAAGKQEGQISGGRAVLCPVDYRSRNN